MPRRRSDKALRRAVTGLARLHPDDVAAILAALDPAEKARVDALMAGFAGAPVAAEIEPAAPAFAYEGASPWLLARIDPGAAPTPGKSRDFVVMTEAAGGALRDAAAPFRVAIQANRGGTLLGRLFGSERA